MSRATNKTHEEPTYDEVTSALGALTRHAERLAQMARVGSAAGLQVDPEALRLASHYRAEAAKLRRRLLRRREDLTPEHADQLERRAARLERRAEAKETGARMPRDVRTPAETLARIDELRRELARLLDEASEELAPEDFAAFVQAVGDDARSGPGFALDNLYAPLRQLGVFRDHGVAQSTFRPFRSPLDGVIEVPLDGEPRE